MTFTSSFQVTLPKVLFAVHGVTQAFGLYVKPCTAEDLKSENNL